MAMMPASVMTMAMTMANRGRSMKMPENTDLVSVSRHHGRGDDLTGMHLLDSLDDDHFSLLEAIGHDDVSALLDAGRYAPQLDLLRVIDHEDIAAGLVELDGGLRNQQRRSRRAPLH